MAFPEHARVPGSLFASWLWIFGFATEPVIGPRFARTRWRRAAGSILAAILPDGQISELLSSPICKNISVPALPKSNLYQSRPTPLKGRIAIVTDAGRDAVDAAASGACVITGRVL
jgi:hypothetical protein